jgi:hypothetical protein
LPFSFTLTLAMGDRLDFITTTNDPANDGSDNTQLRVMIDQLVPFQPVPEPSTFALVGIGLTVAFAARRRCK